MNKKIREWVFNLTGLLISILLAFFIGYNAHNKEILVSLIILGVTLLIVILSMIWTGRITIVKGNK